MQKRRAKGGPGRPWQAACATLEVGHALQYPSAVCIGGCRETKEDAMRKILIVALATMLFAACQKTEEPTPPAAGPSAASEASPAAPEGAPAAPGGAASGEASPAASPAAP